MSEADIILAGGGLASGLIALRLAQLRPELHVLVVEAGPHLGGNHTWSSFDGDLTSEQRRWTEPLYAQRWPGYSVAFPRFQRRLAMGYASATSDRLAAAVRAVLPADRLLTGTQVVAVDAHGVTLADRRRLAARAVIDARGQEPTAHLDLRWQKFVGLQVETKAPHGLTEPVIMDATVAQHDGYRFVYVLPFSPRTLLIEDTYYSDGAELLVEALKQRIIDYAASRGWAIARTLRCETGVLPIALGGDLAALWAEGPPGVARAGLRAGLFHPTTGYSFPDAVRTADLVAALPAPDAASIHHALHAASLAAWRARRSYRLLNRMLFDAALPHERYRVLERFYTLDERLVGRFYAGTLSFADKARLLIGKPPVPVGRALRALLR